MSNIKKGFIGAVGNTPIVELSNFSKIHNIKTPLLAKLECMNPGGSSKDRVALSMIEDAEEKGFLKEGSVIIEPTSGNTGIGLAAVAACRGYRTILTMPETMSIERRKLLKALGAEIVLTKANLGMTGAIAEANRIAQEIEGSFIPGQFDNMANPEAHFKTTGPEIWNDTDGQIDIFVCAVGTGGTLTGAGKYLKSRKESIKIYAVEPKNSNILSGGKAGPHKLQGIGAGFVPSVLDTKLYDGVITVSDSEAFEYSRQLAKYEGILVGISSGAALCASVKTAKLPENTDKRIVAVLCDTGNRYISTELFE